MYQVSIIHPTAAAEFTMTINARSKGAALVAAYNHLNSRFGSDRMHMVGSIKRVAA